MTKAKWYNYTFFGIGWRLLSSYLMVMATILSLFATGAYIFVSRSLYNQLDKKLLTLAQSAAYSFSEVEAGGTTYLNLINAVPWRDIFNRDQQSLQWFDAEGKLLGSKGDIKLDLPPTTGPKTIQQVEDLTRVRTYTISVFKNSPEPNQRSLEGYIRASQSMKDLEQVQSQLRWGLGMAGIFSLGLVGLSGFWLTRRALEPMEGDR